MALRTAIANLKSISPYSQSGFLVSEKKDKEAADAYEARCWKERLHVDKVGNVIVPAMALKYSIDEACKRLAIPVPGEGKARYTRYFEAGYMVPNDPNLGIKASDVEGEWIWVSSTGQKGKGGGRRVRRCYPTIPAWEATVEFVLLDDKIPEDVFAKCLESAGLFVGIGRFRPENQGYYGRFKVERLDWK